MKKLLNIIDKAEEILISIMMVIITVITFGNVVSRKFLHMSWAFTEEITVNLLVWIVFLGASVAAKYNAHLGLSILVDILPKRISKILSLISIIAVIIFLGILCYEGINTVKVQIGLKQMTPALGWPQWLFSLSVPAGSFIILIRFIQIGIDLIKKK